MHPNEKHAARETAGIEVHGVLPCGAWTIDQARDAAPQPTNRRTDAHAAAVRAGRKADGPCAAKDVCIVAKIRDMRWAPQKRETTASARSNGWRRIRGL